MTEPDYKIEELFDFDKMKPYYLVLKLSVIKEYMLIKKFDELDTAKECVRMMRMYKNRIFHYVE